MNWLPFIACPEPVEGLTAHRLPFTIYDLNDFNGFYDFYDFYDLNDLTNRLINQSSNLLIS